jgi:PD-(D/E)XK endonuclease
MAQSPHSTCYSEYRSQITLKSAAIAALFVFCDELQSVRARLSAVPLPVTDETPRNSFVLRMSFADHILRGHTLGFSKETIASELEHTAKLSMKSVGELAELAFMRKAASMGFAVAKPWGDNDRYDVIVRFKKIFWRVQVKSVIASKPTHSSFRVKTVGGSHSRYSADEIDFLVAYIFAKDAWYIFPTDIIAGRDSVSVRPESKRCRLIKYREAWDLMKSLTARDPAECAVQASLGRSI